MRTLSYAEQIATRAAHVSALNEEIAELRKQLALLKDSDRLRRVLAAVLDTAPDVSCDWQRPAPPCRYTVTDWQWVPEDGRTPERFEEALDAADRLVRGLPAKEEGA